VNHKQIFISEHVSEVSTTSVIPRWSCHWAVTASNTSCLKVRPSLHQVNE